MGERAGIHKLTGTRDHPSTEIAYSCSYAYSFYFGNNIIVEREIERGREREGESVFPQILDRCWS